MQKLNVLLVEDKPSDVRIFIEAFKENKASNNLSIVGDGEEAINYLLAKGKYADAPKPDIVLLDLKLPKKSGIEVLKVIRNTPAIATLPVVVMSNSDAESDINKSYKYQANCYITKPFTMAEFVEVAGYIEKFWMKYVRLPERK